MKSVDFSLNEVLRHSLESNFTWSGQAMTLHIIYEFKNDSFKITDISPRGLWVNPYMKDTITTAKQSTTQLCANIVGWVASITVLHIFNACSKPLILHAMHVPNKIEMDGIGRSDRALLMDFPHYFILGKYFIPNSNQLGNTSFIVLN